MMNIRNFHLKSSFLSFNPEILDEAFSKQFNVSSRNKLNKQINKPSQKVQMLMKNFRLASKMYSDCKSTNENNQKTGVCHFDFEPPTSNQKRKALKYMSCTLSPKKSTQKLSSYQIYKLSGTENIHKRRFSDHTNSKGKISKTNSNQKPKFKPEKTQKSLNNKYQPNPMKTMKQVNSLKVFQIDQIFNGNENEHIIHGMKNGSFVTTLPSKRRNRNVKSSYVKERRVSNSAMSPQKEPEHNLSKITAQKEEKNEEIPRSIHTAGSVTARRIDYDKTNMAPVSAAFFPHSSIWNRQQDFVKHSNIEPRSYKLLDKSAGPLTNSKTKDHSYRPWSPAKPENFAHYEEQVFSPVIGG